MASRSEEVFIILKAVGAAAARRQIDSVADAMGRLNSESDEHITLAKDETVATEKKTAATKKDTDATLKQTAAQKKMADGQAALLNGLKRYTKGEVGLTKERLEAYKYRQKIAAMEKRTNDQALRERMAAMRAEQKAQREFEREKAAVRRQTLAAERDLDRRLRISHRQQEQEQRRHFLIQERDAKNALARRKRLSNLFSKIKLPPNAGFNNPIRVAFFSTLVFAALDAVNFLATGLNGLAAGAIAATNGLAPLAGMLVTLPAGLLAMGQAVAVLKMGFAGIGKAFTSDKALDKLPDNARQFVLAGRILKKTYADLGRNVQNKLFKNLGDEASLLGNRYLPVLNRQLGNTAEALNRATVNLTQWLRSKEGVNLMTRLLKSNNVIIENGAFAVNHMLEALVRLSVSAAPMMRNLSKDFRGVTNDFDNWLQKNDKRVTAFFNHSYRTFKRVLHVLGDLGHGVFNIFKLSAPLTEAMGKSIEKGAKDFRKWTESEEGIKAINKYFKEMKPVLYEIVGLAGDLAKGLFDIGRSPNFLATIKAIRTELLPSLIEIIKASDGKFLPAIIKVIKGIEVLAKSGVIDIIANVFLVAANAFFKVATWFSERSDWTKKFIIWGLLLYGIFAKPIIAVMKLVGWVVKLGGALKALKVGKGIAGLFGGGGAAAIGSAAAATSVVPAGGGGKGKGAKVGRGARVAGAASKVLGGAALVSGVAAAGGMLVNWVNGKGQGAKSGDIDAPFKNQRGKGIEGGVNSFASGLAAIDKDDKSSGFAKKIDRWGAAILGVKPKVTVVREAMGRLDKSLASNKAPKAAADFNKMRIAAEKKKIPLDKLIALFPNYSAKVFASGERAKIMGNKLYSAADKAQIMSGKLNGVPIPAGKAGEAMLRADQKARDLAEKLRQAGSGAGGLSNNLGKVPKPAYDAARALKAAGDKAIFLADHIKTANGWINKLNVAKLGKAAKSSGKFAYNLGGDRFAGGTTTPGSMYVTGELGPEATITRSGKMGMVGANGPQLFSPSVETAIIPSSATFNPGSGAYGNAPDWAKSAFQSAMRSGDTKVKSSIPQNRDSNRDTMTMPNITITGNTMSSNIDLEAAITSAYSKMMRERAERR